MLTTTWTTGDSRVPDGNQRQGTVLKRTRQPVSPKLLPLPDTPTPLTCHTNWVITASHGLAFNPCGFENDTDQDTNFYNNLTSTCEYYTDSNCTEKISKINGLSFIHFTARSLNKNFQKIEDYILELSLQFDIISTSETWMELNLHDFNMTLIVSQGEI